MHSKAKKEKETLKEFQQIPGIGPSIAQDLYELGYRSISELTTEDPQVMYDNLCQQRGCHVDRCVLYVFRCAIYYATSTQDPDPHLLKWWNWKDG